MSIALAEIEFAANDVISGTHIAANVDALNVDMRPFFNRNAGEPGMNDVV
jgi:hypothetical protein